MKTELQPIHSVIICTLNREESLMRLLNSIVETKIGRKLQVILIDSASNEEFRVAMQSILIQHFHHTSVCVFEKGGLPTSRNRALTFIKAGDRGLVHFFDDDITIEKNYFEKVLKYFNMNGEVAGAGPLIRGLYLDDMDSKKNRVRKIASFLSADVCENFGRITESGKNFWVPANFKKDNFQVDWIPGCCMIFRPVVLTRYSFNESLEKGPGQNYALGEDVDFTWRVSREFILSAIKEIEIVHHLSSSKRDNVNLMVRANALWIGFLSKIASERVSNTKALLSLYFPVAFPTLQLVYDFLRSCRSLIFNAIKLIRIFIVLPASLYKMIVITIFFIKGKYSKRLKRM
jgi:GT2 family glycosyltransferase